MLRRFQVRASVFILLCWWSTAAVLRAENIDVTLKVSVIRKGAAKTSHVDSSDVVVWLTPTQPSSAFTAPKPGRYRLIQKDKRFTPHLLVIPTGSTVDFPNLDPFFHNVFSLFNGKRFDLGLYESGTSRTVHFNRDGVSYIFCNIHAEMSAVILTVATPYYGVSTANGDVKFPAVPPGSYNLNVWIEGASPEDLRAAGRKVQITPSAGDLGSIEIKVDSQTGPHKNKFGDDYHDPDASPY